MSTLVRLILISFVLSVVIPACNSNKIACPTYKDSFPEKKAKAQTKPDIPKPTKTKSGLLPANAKRR